MNRLVSNGADSTLPFWWSGKSKGPAAARLFPIRMIAWSAEEIVRKTIEGERLKREALLENKKPALQDGSQIHGTRQKQDLGKIIADQGIERWSHCQKRRLSR